MTRTCLLLLPLAACAPDVPAAPSYQQHVQPILAANCVRCHGEPVIGGAPEELRLDAYGDRVILDPDGVGEVTISGAATFALASAIRVAASAAPMPPRFPLDDYQIETLERWAQDPVRGAPRPGNRPPTIELASTAQEGALVTLDARIGDPDPDIVSGVLQARLGATVRPLGLVHSGDNRIVWDTAGLAQADYALVAVLDDGAAEIVVDLGTLTVRAP
jgi:hypothetical protein